MKKICTTRYGEIYITQQNNKAVIVKIDFDEDNMKNVQEFDGYFNHELLCKIFQIDLHNHSITMEYVEGISLADIKSFEQRVDFATIFFTKWISFLPKMEYFEKHKPTLYSEKFKSILDKCDEEKIRKYHLEKLFSQYRNELQKIVTENLFLLHGDVHRRNMILVNDNQIKLIDLSPVIGPVMFEYVKFFEEELYGILTEEEFNYRYNFMLHSFKIIPRDFLPLLFLDSCYRMFDTLFIDNDDSELATMTQLNNRIWRKMKNGLEI